MLRIKSIRFKNFLSYGDAFQGYEFGKGLVSVSAPSGNGKSVLLDALSYALYGQPCRDVKLDDLVNRANMSGMAAECEFDAGNDSYKVGRGRKPDSLWIEKNGKRMDKASSSSLTQEAIVRLIGIDFAMFRRVICISTVNCSPFLDSPKESRRRAKDQLFSLEVLGLMLRKAKEEATLSNTDVAVCDKALDNAENEAEKAEEALAEHDSRVRLFKESQERAVREIDARIAESEEETASAEREMEKAARKKAGVEAKLAELGIESALSEESDLKARRLAAAGRLEALRERVERGEGECESCGQRIGPECVKEAESGIPPLEREIEGLDVKLEAISAKKELAREGSRLVASLDVLAAEKKAQAEASRQATARLKESREAERGREYPDSDSARKRKAEADKALVLARKDRERAARRKLVNKEVQMALGDDGVKASIISAMLPMFNGMVAVNCQKFGLPMSVEFDERMEETVREKGEERPYKGCSEGEKARMNLAVQMAMLEISRAVSGWDCNLMILDEVLDNSLDVQSVLGIAERLRDKAEEGGKTVVVISHKLASSPASVFDKAYTVSKHLGFSVIE